jgi:hypothetical protein
MSMPPKGNQPGVNRHHYGHPSVMTLFAGYDGRPKELKSDASEEEQKEWVEATTKWALRGSAEQGKISLLLDKDKDLLRERLGVSKENAGILRVLSLEISNIKETERTIKEIQATLDYHDTNLSMLKDKKKKLEDESGELKKKRMRIDCERKILKQEVDKLKALLE